ncbi:MAG: transcription termination factor NusA [Acidobacteriota bacterium]
MSNELIQTIEQVAREKSIDVDVIVEAMEEAIVAASKKYYKTRENLVSRFNRDTSFFEVYAQKTVVAEVEDEDTEISIEEAQKIAAEATLDAIIEFPRSTEGLTRVAAQAAKQVIYQKVREAERDNIYAEYIDRVGEIINGIVKRFERGDMIVDLGRTEAIMPRREQPRSEHYNPGDRIRAVIVAVERAAKGPQVVLSRNDPLLVKKLFEMEVPEIYDGTVVIETCVRDPGDRSKIAVRSNERDIDPVGACVGMKGSRVQSVIRELRGEKIDIVQWSPDPLQLVQNSLNPAKINRVAVVDEDERLLEVVVSEDQLSLAIGKKGQNVRLASRLAGWKIDIKSEAEKVREVEREMDHLARSRAALRELPGVGEATAQRLIAAGFDTLDDVARATVEDLMQVPHVGESTATQLLETACAALDDLIAEEQARYDAEDQALREAQEAARQADDEARRAADAVGFDLSLLGEMRAPDAAAENAATVTGEVPSPADESAAEPAGPEETPEEVSAVGSTDDAARDTPRTPDTPVEGSPDGPDGPTATGADPAAAVEPPAVDPAGSATTPGAARHPGDKTDVQLS